MDNLTNGFQDDSNLTRIQEMAEHIAIESNAVSDLSDQVKKRKESLDQAKADLAMLMMQSGMESVKLDNGLTPRAKIAVKYFKGKGLSDDELFGWLKDHDLGGIIKPTVNWSTLNVTVAEYVDQWGELPDIFQKQETPTVTMYGGGKFLLRLAEGRV